MVVVLLLADFDAGWRSATVKEIWSRFASELEAGNLLVLHVAQEFYPPLQGAAIPQVGSHPCWRICLTSVWLPLQV